MVEPGTFHREEREWCNDVAVTLRLPMQVQVTRRLNNSVALYRGPLLLALPTGEAWHQIGGEVPHADWEVLPTTPWNYALRIDPNDVKDRCTSTCSLSAQSRSRPMVHLWSRRSWGSVWTNGPWSTTLQRPCQPVRCIQARRWKN
jgi:hypothetical protein